MHVAALEGGFGKNLADGGAEGRRDRKATTNSTPLRPRRRKPTRKSFQEERLSRLAMSTARIWRRPSQSIPMAMSTAWLVTTPPSRTFS